MKKKKSTFAYLEIRSFIGLVPWAQHYTGTIITDDYQRTYVEHRINQKEAIEFNKNESRESRYRPGDISTRFFTQEAVVRSAIRVFKKEIVPKGYKYLILGDSCVHKPQKIIVGEGKIVKRINELAVRAHKVGYWDNETEMKKISAEWDKLFNKL